jgi:hypothetical protein
VLVLDQTPSLESLLTVACGGLGTGGPLLRVGVSARVAGLLAARRIDLSSASIRVGVSIEAAAEWL